jgi:hypothetical protein
VGDQVTTDDPQPVERAVVPHVRAAVRVLDHRFDGQLLARCQTQRGGARRGVRLLVGSQGARLLGDGARRCLVRVGGEERRHHQPSGEETTDGGHPGFVSFHNCSLGAGSTIGRPVARRPRPEYRRRRRSGGPSLIKPTYQRKAYSLAEIGTADLGHPARPEFFVAESIEPAVGKPLGGRSVSMIFRRVEQRPGEDGGLGQRLGSWYGEQAG